MASAHVIQEDALSTRYFYKLSTNAVGLVTAAVTQMLVPRALGPAAYGSFSFLSTFFSQVVSFVDSGTSMGLYNKLAHRSQEPGLIRFYWGFTGVLSLLVVGAVASVQGGGLESWLWPGQDVKYVWMAAVWGLLTWYAETVNKMVDAYGLTVDSELARAQQQVLGLCLIVLLFWFHRLSLTWLFLYHYLMVAVLCLAWWRVLRRAGQALFPTARLTALEVKRYSQEFYAYSAPLVAYASAGLLAGVMDRWLLQKFAGSTEQGFYGLSYQIGALCFVFTKAMTPLLMREFSRAFGNRDLEQVRTLFQRYIPMLYAVAAFLGVFCAVQAPKIGQLIGGHAYTGAALAIAIMAFYPIHQTYGQLSGSLFYATGQTRLYRNIGISTMLLGLPATFWLVAPKTWSGLGLGATGLAMKMVVLQFIGVNLQLWFNTRFLGLSFWKMFWHQLYSVTVFAGIAWLAATSVDLLLKDTLWTVVSSGLLYTVGCVGVVFLFPAIVSLPRTELKRHVARFTLRMTSWRSPV